eukprot:gene9146-10119_t
MARLVSLFVKALLPRFLFLGHGFVGIFVLSLTEKNQSWWALSLFLVLIVCEGIYIVLWRKGKEFDWFCPSAFSYSIVLLTVLFHLRSNMVNCIVNGTDDGKCGTNHNYIGDRISTFIYSQPIGGRAGVIEQTGVFILIIGRWTLPKGSISRDQFSQILLIYVGTAADIVEFSELYEEEQVRALTSQATKRQIYTGVMVVWGWSILQFSLTIALPEDGLKQEEEEDIDNNPANIKWRQTNRVQPQSYMHYKAMLTKGWDAEAQKKKQRTEQYAMKWRGEHNMHHNQHPVPPEQQPAHEEEEPGCGIKRGEVRDCILKHLELISCLIPVLMQDGPFFVYRMVLMIQHKISTQMIILLTVKNALVIIVQIYRIMILYCCEPREDESELDDATIRVRAALKANMVNSGVKRGRGSVAIQAISRMQWQYLHHKQNHPAPET